MAWQPDTIRVSDDNADCRNAVAHHPSRIAKKRPWVNGEFIRKDAWCSFAVPLFVVDRILAHVIFCFFWKMEKILVHCGCWFLKKILAHRGCWYSGCWYSGCFANRLLNASILNIHTVMKLAS